MIPTVDEYFFAAVFRDSPITPTVDVLFQARAIPQTGTMSLIGVPPARAFPRFQKSRMSWRRATYDATGRRTVIPFQQFDSHGGFVGLRQTLVPFPAIGVRPNFNRPHRVYTRRRVEGDRHQERESHGDKEKHSRLSSKRIGPSVESEQLKYFDVGG